MQIFAQTFEVVPKRDGVMKTKPCQKGAKRKLGRPKGSGTGGAAKRRRVRRNSDGTGQQPGVQRNRYDVMQIQKEALFYFPQQGDIDRTRQASFLCISHGFFNIS